MTKIDDIIGQDQLGDATEDFLPPAYGGVDERTTPEGQSQGDGSLPHDEEFPSHLGKAFERLDDLRGIAQRLRDNCRNHTDVAKYREAEAKVTALAKHIFQMQQGTPPVDPTTAANQFLNAKRATQELYQKSIEVADKMESELGKPPIFPAVREVANPLALSPLEWLLADETIRSIIVRYADLRRRYAISYYRNQDILNPETTVDRLKREIVNSKDPERIREFRDQLSTAMKMAETKHSNPVILSLRTAIMKPIFESKPVLIGLCVAAEHLLGKLLDEAIKEESIWFGQFGIEPVRTQLSRRIIHEIGKFASFRKSLSSPHQPFSNTPPPPGSTPLENLFGIKL